MKKTVSISLNGLAFIVEEDAYSMLKDYLKQIRICLESNQDGSEILSDVESRISEILSSKISDTNQTVNVSMINYVIDTIGAPHYFKDDNSQEKKKNYTPPPFFNFKKVRKKLFRDPNRKILGGVCSGIASYFRCEIALIRFIAIVLFICSGVGVIAYIVLWIVIPEAVTKEEIDMVNSGYNNN